MCDTRLLHAVEPCNVDIRAVELLAKSNAYLASSVPVKVNFPTELCEYYLIPLIPLSVSLGTAQDGDDVCVVCFTDRLCAAPCVQLGCGHLLHYHCVRAVLEKRWPGPRILFRFMNCPLCNVPVSVEN